MSVVDIHEAAEIYPNRAVYAFGIILPRGTRLTDFKECAIALDALGVRLMYNNKYNEFAIFAAEHATMAGGRAVVALKGPEIEDVRSLRAGWDCVQKFTVSTAPLAEPEMCRFLSYGFVVPPRT